MALYRLNRAAAAFLVLCFAVQGARAAPLEEASAQTVPRSRIVRPIDDNARVTLAGNRHPEASDANDIGAVEDAFRLERLILTLKADNAQNAALKDFLESAHDRSSPRYGQWTTPKSFGEVYGVAIADITRVAQWLTDHGFTIDEVPPGRRAIVFSGTVAQVRNSFRTEIRRYAVNGKSHIANAADPQVPQALAVVVDGVVSLHNFHSRPLQTRVQATPDFTSGAAHYLAAADFHTIYNLKPLYARGIDGSGTSIAILGRSNVVPADIAQFRATMNLPANPPQIIVNGADPGLVSGDQGESDLDLEWAGAVAPAAAIRFVTSASTASTDGIDLSAQYAVNNNAADVISLSYGLCERSMGAASRSFYSNLWQQAAAAGITVAVSSGDSGAAGCDDPRAVSAGPRLGVNGLCTSPYSTCVGGTQFADLANPSLYWTSNTNPADQSSALSYIPEVVWNESGANGGTGLWASGGGASRYIGKPSWQTAPGVPADGWRDVPDVALTAAAHDGYLVYSSDNATQTQTLYAFSGTSASAPSFAGIVALVDQQTGYRQGGANPTLYALASRQAGGGAPAYFHHITSGNNSVPGATGFSASAATPYYNQATGLGSVDANVLVSHWTDLLPASSTALTVAPNPSTLGQSVTLTATVTGASPTGTVQFADGASNLGSPVALSGGVATLVTPVLAAGSHGITAAYSGDPANQPGLSPVWVQSVLAATAVGLSSSPASIAAGQAVSFTAGVSGAMPTGTVQFKDGGANLGAPVALDAAAATLNTNALTTAGSHSITAVYSGDAANASGTSQALIENVVPAASTVSIGTSTPWLTEGQSVTFTATVIGMVPTGSVQFTDGGAGLGAPVLIDAGIAALSTSTLSVGSHRIAAIYSGDGNNYGSTSAAITENITAVGSAATGDADVPTLPEWAALLLGMFLISTIWRRAGGAVALPAGQGLRPARGGWKARVPG